MHQFKHSFDWRGFKFFLGIVVFLTAIGFGLKEGVYHFYSNSSSISTKTLSSGGEAEKINLTDYQLPIRTLRTLTIADVIPKEGKFVAADLVNMQIFLYQDGLMVGEYPIKTKGRSGTPWETPAGLYKIKNKEKNHFSSIGKVYMPYSMQFYGNYFIHGWTYYPDGTPTAFTFSGGCIKLDTDNAKKVFDFAEVGTPVFVYDSKQTETQPSLSLSKTSIPNIAAGSWLVADLDTGDVFAEQGAQIAKNPEYATTLMAALVANETISLDKKISVPEGSLTTPPDESNTTPKTFLVDDLFFPLLLQTNSAVADALASYYGKQNFIRSMNATAHALDMSSTKFSGIDSGDNVTTAEDLYRLAWYLTNKKSFILKIAGTQKKSIFALDDSKYDISQSENQSNILVKPITIGAQIRRIAIITLDSPDLLADSSKLSSWISNAVTAPSQPACVSCVTASYRKIDP